MGGELMQLFSYQDERGYGCQISSSLRLCDVCQVGDALTYTDDFGDNWQHWVTVEKVMARPTGTYPRVVTGKYACPPEDCGGPTQRPPTRTRRMAGRDGRSQGIRHQRSQGASIEYVEASMPKTQPVV